MSSSAVSCWRLLLIKEDAIRKIGLWTSVLESIDPLLAMYAEQGIKPQEPPPEAPPVVTPPPVMDMRLVGRRMPHGYTERLVRAYFATHERGTRNDIIRWGGVNGFPGAQYPTLYDHTCRAIATGKMLAHGQVGRAQVLQLNPDFIPNPSDT